MLEEILKNAALGSANKGIHFVNKNKEEFIDYKKLYNDSKQCGQWLKEKGTKQGDAIVILVEDRRSFITIIWACFIYGYTAVPMDCISSSNDLLGLRNIKSIFKSIAKAKIITDEKQFKYLKQSNHDFVNDIFLFPDFKDLEVYVPEKPPTQINEEAPAIIMFTSGSVSDPKGVVLTEQNIFGSIHQVVERVHYNESDVIINWMSLTHAAGLILLHLIPVYSRSDEVVLTSDFFVRYPKEFLNLIGKFSGTVTMLPNFALEFLVNYGKVIDLSSYKLDSLRCVINGAEPINYRNIQEFTNTFEICGFNSKAMIAIYGMTETTTALTMHDPNENEDKFYSINKEKYFSEDILCAYDETGGERYDLAFVGTPVNGTVFKVCDENGKEMKPGVIGNIMAKGPNIARTFINSQGTHSLLNEEHYLDTGDMGCFINGQLIITGRKKDVIIFNGRNFYPEDIENICKEILGDARIECLACAATNPNTLKDELIIFLERASSDTKSMEEIVKEKVSKAINQPVKYVISVDAISKNRIGKKQRYKMKKQFENGEFINYMIKGECHGEN